MNLYMFDSDARCKCGQALTCHRDHMFSNRSTGHRVGWCNVCRTWVMYDRATHPYMSTDQVARLWAKVKATWERGKPLNATA